MEWFGEVSTIIVGGLVPIGFIALLVWMVMRHMRRRTLTGLLTEHFQGLALDQIAITERHFPFHIRLDLQGSVMEFLATGKIRSFTGVGNQQAGFGEGISFFTLLDERFMGLASGAAGPPQYEQIDIGDDEPVQGLKSGLWLLEAEGNRYAVLYTPISQFGECGITQRLRLQIATAGDEAGEQISRKFFRHIEQGVLDARSYRGKVLSFEQEDSYSGASTGVKVHRLRSVAREEVILPAKTLELLDRNVINFVQRSERLRQFAMSTKKGLLFYGPPGTGKTHTIRYLAGSLARHTTLLISAEQIGLLGEYMTLARLLQPSMVVMEDVDLLARSRAKSRNATTELLLNKLLNEMDGLREDADILFILTTNRPEELEGALASRPGRIDQAIEFPLPNAAGREKLVRLYAGGIDLTDEVTAEIVKRTEKVSASFIKELMRRATQFNLEGQANGKLSSTDIANALDEMLFSGGSLNLKLLGAEERADDL